VLVLRTASYCTENEGPLQGRASTHLAARHTPHADAQHLGVMRGRPAANAALTCPLGALYWPLISFNSSVAL
jgi:hypothetical protein